MRLDRIRQNRREYDRISKAYDSPAQLNSARDNLGPLFKKVKQGGVLVDLGSGPGNNLALLLTKHPTRLYVVDNSQAMLTQAKTKFSTDSRCTFSKQLFANLSLPEPVDFIMAHLAFVHVPHTELPIVLNRVKSCLKPSGLFFSNYFAGPDTTKLLTSDWGDEKRVQRYFSFYRVATLRRLYQKTGLEILQLTTRPGEHFKRLNVWSRST